jgi:hypothetical protein
MPPTAVPWPSGSVAVAYEVAVPVDVGACEVRPTAQLAGQIDVGVVDARVDDRHHLALAGEAAVGQGTDGPALAHLARGKRHGGLGGPAQLDVGDARVLGQQRLGLGAGQIGGHRPHHPRPHMGDGAKCGDAGHIRGGGGVVEGHQHPHGLTGRKPLIFFLILGGAQPRTEPAEEDDEAEEGRPHTRSSWL